jgi:hypothetical protein
MTLFDWAKSHGITEQALKELTDIFGLYPITQGDKSSEASIQVKVRLEASKQGARLFRNNVGGYQSDAGFVRYGLCNESAQMNKAIKSSDLIGIKPVVITQAMVGSTIGQFMAREVKRGGWYYTGTPREVAQLKFLEIVNALGGDGRFTNGIKLC